MREQTVEVGLQRLTRRVSDAYIMQTGTCEFCNAPFTSDKPVVDVQIFRDDVPVSSTSTHHLFHETELIEEGFLG